MNALDIIIVIPILLFAVFGLKKGLLKSIFTYLSVIFGILFAVKFNSAFSFVLKSVIKDSKLTQVLSIIIIFLILYFLGIFLASKIAKINKISEILDKVGGFIFGVLKSILIIGLILILLNAYGVIPDNQKQKSVLYAPVTTTVPKTYNFLKDIIPFQKKDFYMILNQLELDSLKQKFK